VSHTTAGAGVALLTAALLVGCGSGPSTPWAIDVRYSDLEPGTCLAASYGTDNVLQVDEFEANATFFQAVDCAGPHRAQVVGVVEIPASPQWDDFGTGDGPNNDEARDWVTDVCLAYGALVENYLESHQIARALEVSPNRGVFGDAILGTCLAHTADFEPFEGGGIDIDAMLGQATQGFDAELLGTSDDWLIDPLEGPVTTLWSSVDPFGCVDTYANADQKEYGVVACALPHQAQFLGWVRMPDEWSGYQGDLAAHLVVNARCEELRAAIAASAVGVADVVVDPSDVAEKYVVNGRNLAQCWAHRPDLSDLGPDLRAVFAPEPVDQPVDPPAE
jgi:hypothetical protein